MIHHKYFCLGCGTETIHRSYCEQDTICYNGVEIEYTDKGYICEVCGETFTPADMFDEVLQEIRDEYSSKKH